MSDAPRAPIPPSIGGAIRDAAEDETGFAIACRAFVEDMNDARPGDLIGASRLEHAVARATLDAWRRGLGSEESVGRAYAAVGNRVARAPRA